LDRIEGLRSSSAQHAERPQVQSSISYRCEPFWLAEPVTLKKASKKFLDEFGHTFGPGFLASLHLAAAFANWPVNVAYNTLK
jgi:hypothetical protein